MEETHICGIYAITCILETCSNFGMTYIGQSRDILGRWENHKVNTESHIGKAIQKYGTENFKFQTLKECPVEHMNDLEAFFIRVYCSWHRNYGYNKTFGGGQNFYMTPESNKKKGETLKVSLRNSEKAKAYHQSMIGTHRTVKTKEKQSKGACNSWVNGRDISNYKGGHRGPNLKLRGVKKAIHKDGINKNIKINELDNYLNDGWKTGYCRINDKDLPVRCIETKIIYNSLNDAIKITGLNIKRVLRGERITVGGLHWEYVNIS